MEMETALREDKEETGITPGTILDIAVPCRSRGRCRRVVRAAWDGHED
ncbi:hypothetical protein HNR23_002200 [Nocardiopsis mwathae]|uniref:Nudix hydrolase domain-containing protein n=1 Tax=Nocardiopsis mwathae TaxID=1472723 RepID=A0A7W9YHN5_9ACTN|nr:hypothetical protein [Nocardiopsis mwathae]MBB6172140.1 hypothetical protein [Nocardiopsis mwathae]